MAILGSKTKIKNEELEAQVLKLEDEAIVSAESITELTAEKETLEANAIELNESITELQSKLDESTEKLNEANEAIDKHAEEMENFDKRVGEQALTLVASAGTEPVKVSKKDDEVKELDRSAFAALSSNEKLAFSKAGGRIK